MVVPRQDPLRPPALPPRYGVGSRRGPHSVGPSVAEFTDRVDYTTPRFRAAPATEATRSVSRLVTGEQMRGTHPTITAIRANSYLAGALPSLRDLRGSWLCIGPVIWLWGLKLLVDVCCVGWHLGCTVGSNRGQS